MPTTFYKFALNLLFFVPALALAQATPSAEHHLSDDLQVLQLTEGVWRFVSYQDQGGDWGRIAANGLVVVSDRPETGKVAALIDTPWTDEQTGLLFHWAEETLGAKITVVVPTHSHGDCLGGLGAAHTLGAHSYGHEKTAEFARRDGHPAPRTTFEDHLEIPLGERRLELRHLGPGHTVDNIVVWIPDEKILFGGCLVKAATSQDMGYIDEADLKAWPETIARVAAAFPDAALIVPGHGPPGGAETLRRTVELIEAHQRAQAAQSLDAQPFFTAVSVKDVDASAAWYGKIFGFEVTREIDLKERGIRIRLLRGDSAFLELVEDSSAVSARERIPEVEKIAQVRGFFKSGVLVHDLDAAVERLKALGVPLRGKIVTESDGSFRSAQIEDPDGNVWQLFERLTPQP